MAVTGYITLGLGVSATRLETLGMVPGVVAAITTAWPQWTLRAHRAEWTLDDEIADWTLPAGRAEWTLPDDS